MNQKVSHLPTHVAEDSPPAIQNASHTKGAIAALVPESLDDVFRTSKALSGAGQMVPDVFRGNPDMIMAAILRGMEIGLAPMQALSNIAVINGRASVWGDALPAMMQRAGHHVDVEVVGEGESMKAVAVLTRGDTGREITREFSIEDAKKAGLWGKKGPWQSYPKRMLMHRARAWACRDGAADALMGLQISEEMQDAPPMRDVTPRSEGGGGFAALANKARQEEQERTRDGQGGETPQGTEQAAHGAENEQDDASDQVKNLELAEDDADPFADAYTEGVQAFSSGAPEDANPYDGHTDFDSWNNWLTGYRFNASQSDNTGEQGGEE